MCAFWYAFVYNTLNFHLNSFSDCEIGHRPSRGNWKGRNWFSSSWGKINCNYECNITSFERRKGWTLITEEKHPDNQEISVSEIALWCFKQYYTIYSMSCSFIPCVVWFLNCLQWRSIVDFFFYCFTFPLQIWNWEYKKIRSQMAYN